MQNEYSNSDIITMLSYIDARPDYKHWLEIISSVANYVNNDLIAEQLLLTRFREEKTGELKSKIKNRTQKHTIGTLIYFAKLGGFKFERSNIRNYNDKKLIVEKKKYILPERKRLNYRFFDAVAIEYFNQILKETKCRLTASQKTLDAFPNAKKEREYTLCGNGKVVNKNCSAKIFNESKQLVKFPDYKVLNDNFYIVQATESEIIKAIGNGFAMIFSALKNENEKVIERKIDAFLSAELFAIDIDNNVPAIDENGLKIKDANGKQIFRKKTTSEGYLTFEDAISMELTQDCIAVYTTPTHSPDHHKFRIVFDFDEIIYSAELVKDVIKTLVNKYGADQNATSVVNVFYGNVNAKIYIPKTAEIIEYKDGELCQ